jgi:hypothetical protein
LAAKTPPVPTKAQREEENRQAEAKRSADTRRREAEAATARKRAEDTAKADREKAISATWDEVSADITSDDCQRERQDRDQQGTYGD